ncbi:MAG: phage/plasmid primase, P4 family [Candidatus Nanohaloarchaea archaeon]
METARQQINEDEEGFRNRDGVVVPQRVAKHLMDRFHILTPQDTREIKLYSDGIYQDNGEAELRQEMEMLLDEDCSRKMKKEVLSSIKDRTQVSRDELEVDKRYVNLENGVYDLEEHELKDHSPEYTFFSKHPVKYDEEADCPKVKEFVREVVPTEEDYKAIQELFGYALYRDIPIDQAFMFEGEGSNGKSTLIDLLTKFVGEHNVSGVPLQKLGKRFNKKEMFDKNLNVDADLGDGDINYTSAFKKLIAGDRVRGDVKYSDPIRFRPYAKHVYAANQVPETEDETRAFYRRWNIIEFPKTFTSADLNDGNPDKDPEILEKLTRNEELSGVFNWAIEGLERLLEQGKFSNSESVKATKERYRQTSDPVKAFIDSKVTQDSENVIPKSVVYERFKRYCEENDQPVKPQQNLTKKLKSMMHVGQERPNLDEEEAGEYGLEPGRVRCYKGVDVQGVQGGDINHRTCTRRKTVSDTPADSPDDDNGDNPDGSDQEENDYISGTPDEEEIKDRVSKMQTDYDDNRVPIPEVREFFIETYGERESVKQKLNPENRETGIGLLIKEGDLIEQNNRVMCL